MNKFPSAEGPVRYPTYLLSRRFGHRRLVDIICQAPQKRNPLTEKSHNYLLKAHAPIKLKKIRGLRDDGFAGARPFDLDRARSTARMAASGIGGKGVSEIANPETAVQAA